MKLACIGLGSHMRKTLYPGIPAKNVELVAICDQQEERLSEFRKFAPVGAEHCYTDFYEMLEKEQPHAVLCAGNPNLHYKVAKACMHRKISPFIEKTPCENSKQARELAILEQQTGCFCMVGFNRRYTTAYCMAKEILEHDFGSPLLYLAKYNSSEYGSEQSFLLNHVIHHLDLMRFLLGEIDDLRAEEMIVDERKTGLHIHFCTNNGVIGFLQSSSFQSETFPMERVEIQGIGKNLIIDNVKYLEYNRSVDKKTEDRPVLSEKEDTLCWNWNMGHSSMYSHYGYERELKEYFQALNTGEKPVSSMEQVVGTMELYEKLLKNRTIIHH